MAEVTAVIHARFGGIEYALVELDESDMLYHKNMNCSVVYDDRYDDDLFTERIIEAENDGYSACLECWN